jgi:hypothetical protein
MPAPFNHQSRRQNEPNHYHNEPHDILSSSRARAGRPAARGEKTAQRTTPLATTFSAEETISVIDPRHPLYGQTLRLIQFTKCAYHGQSCVVWLGNGAERLVPLAATDRSPQPLTISPLPLSLTSAESLVRAYARTLNQIKERAENVQQTNQSISKAPTEPNKRQQRQAGFTAVQSDPLRATLEPPHCRATTGDASPSRQRQSRSHQQSEEQSRQRGGKR